MKIFLSHSGAHSTRVARFLSRWIQSVNPAFETWLDEKDLKPGQHWPTDLRAVLAECDAGIICVTQQNVNKPWPLAEFSNLWKHSKSVVIPYLINIPPEKIPPPMLWISVNVTTDFGLGFQ